MEIIRREGVVQVTSAVNLDEDGRQQLPLDSIVNEAKFGCEVCSYKASTQHKIARHNQSMHSEKHVVCSRSYCGQQFPNKFM